MGARYVPSGPIKGFKPVSDALKVKRVRGFIKALNKERPFDLKKDYYRGQWDALVWVLEDLLGEEL